MTRECGSCAMWKKSADNGRGTRTGYCTLPSVGRQTRSDASCKFYVGAAGRGFDVNVAWDAFDRMQAGKAPKPGQFVGPRRVDAAALRARRL